MLHLGASLPNLSFAADAHYHHLEDDILIGGKLAYRERMIDLPKVPQPSASRSTGKNTGNTPSCFARSAAIPTIAILGDLIGSRRSRRRATRIPPYSGHVDAMGRGLAMATVALKLLVYVYGRRPVVRVSI